MGRCCGRGRMWFAVFLSGEKAFGYETNVRLQVGHATNMNLKIMADV